MRRYRDKGKGDSGTSIEGRNCVVTGATSGIGRCISENLARCGAHVAVVGRNRVRVSEVVRELRARYGPTAAGGFFADLERLSDLRSLTGELTESYRTIYALVNNAGAVFSPRETTIEGVERTWALNVLAPFYLTQRLEPLLVAERGARVVMVASEAHRFGRIHFADPELAYGYSAFRAYNQSKLALVMLTHEFARRWAGRGVTVLSVHPGFVRSGFGLNTRGFLRAGIWVGSRLFGIRPERGAATPTGLALQPQVAQWNGAYLRRMRSVHSSPISYSEELARKLWELCEEYTGRERNS